MEIVPRVDRNALRQALDRLARGRLRLGRLQQRQRRRHLLRARCEEAGSDARAFGRARVCAIGPGTAMQLCPPRPPGRPRAGASSGGVASSRPWRRRRWRKARALAARPRRPSRARRRAASAWARRVDELPLYARAVPKRADAGGDVATARRRGRRRHLRQLVGGAQPAEAARRRHGAAGEAAHRLHRAGDGGARRVGRAARGRRSAGAHHRGAAGGASRVTSRNDGRGPRRNSARSGASTASSPAYTTFASARSCAGASTPSRPCGLDPGDTVLDLACGTGLNFRHIIERIGPEGQDRRRGLHARRC